MVPAAQVVLTSRGIGQCQHSDPPRDRIAVQDREAAWDSPGGRAGNNTLEQTEERWRHATVPHG